MVQTTSGIDTQHRPRRGKSEGGTPRRGTTATTRNCRLRQRRQRPRSKQAPMGRATYTGGRGDNHDHRRRRRQQRRRQRQLDKTRQTQRITIHGALWRAHECGQPLVCISIDGHSAFDSLYRSTSPPSSKSGGTTATQVAAILREIVGARVQPRIGQVKGGWQPLLKGSGRAAPGALSSGTTPLLAPWRRPTRTSKCGSDRLSLGPWISPSGASPASQRL